jgi:phosphorylase/glycogen(starch) synthase
MSSTLFEVTWEVRQPYGGDRAIVAGKARSSVARHGDHYVVVAPYGVEAAGISPGFVEESGPEQARFIAACADRGLKVRVGRWRSPGRPRAVLVDFSALFDTKDDLFARLWERYGVDSLFGDWNYFEPLIFGHAAGLAIEAWHDSLVLPASGRSVAHFHDWLTVAGLLHLHHARPEIGTVLTIHSTALGSQLATTGRPLEDALGGREPDAAASDHEVRAKHSLEVAGARAADVFTTVSEPAASEAERLLGRRPNLLLNDGIDLESIDDQCAAVDRAAQRRRLGELASQLTGRDLTGAAHVCFGGKYEFENKGVDVFLESMRRLDQREGRPIVGWVLSPARTSGPRREVRQRCKLPVHLPAEPLGAHTHELIDPEHDPLLNWLDNVDWWTRDESRVELVHVSAHLDGTDGVLDAPLESVLAAMDLAVFPSFYEPWGSMPATALAVGSPIIVSERSGIGRWLDEKGLGPEDGVTVYRRDSSPVDEAAERLADRVEQALALDHPREQLARACRSVAEKLAWASLYDNYDKAHAAALEVAERRRPSVEAVRAQRRRPVRPVRVEGQGTPRLVEFDVAAALPHELQGLTTLSRNLWWSWDPEGEGLFRDLGPTRWEACDHNPVVFLRRVEPSNLERALVNEAYRTRLDRVTARMRDYLDAGVERLSAGDGAELSEASPAAYFCLEYGLHSSLRVYSGGLGILAGDHLKSASDLQLPLVAVGLFYRRGYVRQELGPSGEQLSRDVDNSPGDLPLTLLRDERGDELRVSVNLAGDEVALRAWRVDVGRVPLYLLDADCPENDEAARATTARLYGGGDEERVRQEIVLGRGGVRLLDALGVEPAVVHMNEGHAAFAALERIGDLVRREDLNFREALEVVRGTTVFTTHTPVPAGHDRFSEELMRRYFADTERWIGLSWDDFMALGTVDGDDDSFNMTYLASSLSGWINGVSEKHGEVSRALLHPFWRSSLEVEVPVHHVTNGIHLGTWVRPGVAALLGAEHRVVRPEDFQRAAADLDPAALWAERRAAKAELLGRVRDSLETSFKRRGDSPKLLNRLLERLPGDGLVVGFARRFAPYKRASLLLQDIERLARLVNNPGRPVLFLFSGKAHPADEDGKALVRQVVEATRRADLLGRLVFLEDYDMHLARYLVQGVDVWLNNPIRPLEASGTSGMKVAANGGLNLSVLDGWWIEGHDGKNGWAIGRDRVYEDQALQDQLDNEHLLGLLEEQVVPLFFERDAGGIPQAWIERVQHDLATLPTRFNTDRMVAEYRDRAYLPMASFRDCLVAGGYKGARALAEQHRRIEKAFGQVQIREARVADAVQLETGDSLVAEVDLFVGSLGVEELQVELVIGSLDARGRMTDPEAVELRPTGPAVDGVVTLRGSARLDMSGRWSYGLRYRPRRYFALDGTLERWGTWI